MILKKYYIIEKSYLYLAKIYKKEEDNSEEEEKKMQMKKLEMQLNI